MDQTDWLAGWLGGKSDRGTMRQREIENYKLFCSPEQSCPVQLWVVVVAELDRVCVVSLALYRKWYYEELGPSGGAGLALDNL